MSEFLGELKNKEIIASDIVYKLQKPIQNAILGDLSTIVITGTHGDRTLETVTSDVNDKSTLPAPTSASVTSTTANGIVTLVKTYMASYVYVQKIYLNNSITGTVRDRTFIAYLQTDQAGVASTVETKVGEAATTNNIIAGSVITAENLNNFINACSDLWKDYCIDSIKKIYTYSYCHSNHSNHTSHGSRGRR